jgi:PAS domain S-box-containing protein
MPANKSQESFRQILDNTGHRIGTTVPIVIALLCCALQYIYGYFDRTPRYESLALVAIYLLIFTAGVFNKHPSRAWRIIQQVVSHIATFYGLAYLIPLPSPYLLYIILIAVVVYFDFGFRAMIGSTLALFAAFTWRFIELHGVGRYSGIDGFISLYVTMLVIAYYSVLFLRIAENELSALKKSSTRAQSTQKRIESLINNISDGVIAVDQHLKVVVYNAAALDVLDLNTDIKGLQVQKLIKPIDANKQPVKISALLADTTAPVINRDLRIQYADGSIANLFLGISPIYLGYGKSENNGYTLLLRDITREKSLEEERDEFISVVSHELRTPIAISEGNIGNAEYIVEKTGDLEAVKTALKEAHHQVLFLADMINDLSTLSRAERGVLEVELEPINVHDLMVELGNNYTPQAEAKGLKFITEIDPKLEILRTSELYSREILQNFITNAIKYTEKGSVSLKAVPTKTGVDFVIKDTGIGISKGDQERVYDKFFRSEDYRTRSSSGTGLGLYVTMKLVRLIHADIDLKSELNKGSTFIVSIPNLEN